MRISPRHTQELAASAIDPKLAQLNCESYEPGDRIYDRFFAGTDINKVSRRTWKDAQWNYIRKAWGHLESGALVFTGVDPDSNWESEMLWMRVKPDKPKTYLNEEKGKFETRKYESPPGTPTRVMYFKIEVEQWEKIAQEYNLQKESPWLRAIAAAAKKNDLSTLLAKWRESGDSLKTGSNGNKMGGMGFSSSCSTRSTRLTALSKLKLLLEKNTQELDLLESGNPTPDALSALSLFVENLPSSEIVPSFWQWMQEHPEVPITYTEGEKKALSLLSRGQVAIALPGIWNGQRKVKDENGEDVTDERGRKIRILHPDLERLAVEGRTIYFAFDRDDKLKTRRNVAKAISATAWLLKERGGNIKVVVWDGRRGKGVDDFIFNGGDIQTAYQLALPLELYSVKQHCELTYPTTQIELTSEKPYLGQHEIPIPENVKLMGIKAPKGAGKTEWLARREEKDNDGSIIDRIPGIVDRINRAFEENYGRPMPVILLTHRRNLGAALAERFGLPVAHELFEAGEGKLFGYALCVDSMHKRSQVRFDPSAYENAIVIIDECEQVLWHLLDANTEVAKHRVEILKNYRLLLSNVLNSEHGRVIVADADLSDVSLNHILDVTEMRNQIQPFVVEAKQLVEQGKRKCYHFNGRNPDRWFYALVKAIERGERPLIMVSGQQSKTTWGTQSLERRIRELCPFASVLRIDSDTTKQPGHRAYGCMSCLDDVIYGYDAVIASPSIETGVSIEDKGGHFTSVWGLSWGLQTEEAFRQALARLRTDVPRYVWCTHTSALGRIGNGSLTPYHLLKSGLQKTEVVLRQLKKSDADIQEWLYDFQSPSQKAWSELAARINGGMLAYRDAVLRGLHGEGYEIRPFEFVESGDTTNEIDLSCCINSLDPIDFIDSFEEDGDRINSSESEIDSLDPRDGTDSFEEDDARVDAGEFDRECEPRSPSYFERGFEVKPSEDELKEVVSSLKESRDRNWHEHNQAVANAEPLTDGKYETLRRANDLTQEERQQVRKFELEQRYGGNLTPELLTQDDKGVYPQWALHYRLTAGREFVQAKDGHHIDGAIERDGALWFVDTNRRCKLPTVAALEAIGFGVIIQELMKNPDREWRDDDPLLATLVKKHKRHPELKEFISIPVNPKYADRPIPVVNGYLRMLGMKLEAIRKERVEGVQHKVYQLAAADKEGLAIGLADGRMEIFQRWAARDRAFIEKWEREKAENEAIRVQQNAVQDTARTIPRESKSSNPPLTQTEQGFEGESKSPYIEINIGDLNSGSNEIRNAGYPSGRSSQSQPRDREQNPPPPQNIAPQSSGGGGQRSPENAAENDPLKARGGGDVGATFSGWKGLVGRVAVEIADLPDYLRSRWEEVRGMMLQVDCEPWIKNSEIGDWWLWVNTWRGGKRTGCVAIPLNWFEGTIAPTSRSFGVVSSNAHRAIRFGN